MATGPVDEAAAANETARESEDHWASQGTLSGDTGQAVVERIAATVEVKAGYSTITERQVSLAIVPEEAKSARIVRFASVVVALDDLSRHMEAESPALSGWAVVEVLEDALLTLKDESRSRTRIEHVLAPYLSIQLLRMEDVWVLAVQGAT